MDDFKHQLHQWKEMERAALAAELGLRGWGQLGASPEVAARFREAARLRKEADDFLDRILGISPRERLAGRPPFLDSEPTG